MHCNWLWESERIWVKFRLSCQMFSSSLFYLYILRGEVLHLPSWHKHVFESHSHRYRILISRHQYNVNVVHVAYNSIWSDEYWVRPLSSRKVLKQRQHFKINIHKLILRHSIEGKTRFRNRFVQTDRVYDRRAVFLTIRHLCSRLFHRFCGYNHFIDVVIPACHIMCIFRLSGTNKYCLNNHLVIKSSLWLAPWIYERIV